jgi:hypothetical protein
VEKHQLEARTKCIEAVAQGAPGSRLAILLDWSEKLSLEPQNSVTAGNYPKIGVLVMVCVYRGKEGVRCETHVGFCEKPTNDVPHTHAVLQQVVTAFDSRSKELRTNLSFVDLWSDGGQTHFKCAEGFVFLSHFVRFVRQLGDSAATVTWNFMQSSHGIETHTRTRTDIHTRARIHY